MAGIWENIGFSRWEDRVLLAQVEHICHLMAGAYTSQSSDIREWRLITNKQYY